MIFFIKILLFWLVLSSLFINHLIFLLTRRIFNSFQFEFFTFLFWNKASLHSETRISNSFPAVIWYFSNPVSFFILIFFNFYLPFKSFLFTNSCQFCGIINLWLKAKSCGVKRIKNTSNLRNTQLLIIRSLLLMNICILLIILR